MDQVGSFSFKSESSPQFGIPHVETHVERIL